MSADAVRALRERLGMSQERFAQELDISVWTVRSWEQTTNPRRPRGLYLRALRRLDAETQPAPSEQKGDAP